jgi:hypothetical protein
MKTLARERDYRELLHRLERLRPDSVRRWGRMTPHQMICHLNDGFRMSLGERPVSSLGGWKGLMYRTTKWMPLYAPVPWPSGVMTRPELAQELGGTSPTEFAADLAECRQLMEVIIRRDDRPPWPRHPFFGRMSRRAWMRLNYLHVDHHLRQFGV